MITDYLYCAHCSTRVFDCDSCWNCGADPISGDIAEPVVEILPVYRPLRRSRPRRVVLDMPASHCEFVTEVV